MRLILLIAVATAGYLIYKLYFQQLIAQGKAGKIKIALIVVGLLFLALAASGRAHVLFGIIGALMTQAMRLVPLLIRFAPFLTKYLAPGGLGAPPFSGNQGNNAHSKVKTQSLNMTLDHATGQIDGEILEGAFSGKKLSALTENEFAQFYAYCQSNDQEAIRLLQAFIARERSDWETNSTYDQTNDTPSNNNSDAINLREAYDILGLDENASKEQVSSAHRALMTQLHPDKGGSNYLAAKVNEAKRIILEHLK